MKFLSMFSGIEAASVAWEPLGWKAAAFCEIDKFASAVLKHHYPNVPNLGDVEKADFDAIGPIDLAVFGSPCQSYSIAGKRLGLDDPRGNLALVGGQVVYRKRPRWFVFENVPGLLSSDSGWDFGTLLASFAGYPPGSVFEPPGGGWRNSGSVRQAEVGYGLAWRVLDAQYVRVDGFGRAVPQRRRRVFVVGYLGDWRRAAAVLFERESLSGNPPPRRSTRQDVAPTISARTKGGGGLGTDFDLDGGLISSSVAPTLRAGGNDTGGDRPYGTDVDTCDSLVAYSLQAGSARDNPSSGPDGVGVQAGVSYTLEARSEVQFVAHTLNAKGGVGRLDYESETLVAHSLRGGGFDASEDGTGRGTPLVPVVFAENSRCELRLQGGDGMIAPQLTTGGGKPGQGQPCIAFNARQDPDVFNGHTGPLDTDGSTQGIFSSWRVRRLMPVECERLQGFPDRYTDVPWRKKNWTPDGPRYKAIGNSMAVPVMRWIGWRIAQVDKLCSRC